MMELPTFGVARNSVGVVRHRATTQLQLRVVTSCRESAGADKAVLSRSACAAMLPSSCHRDTFRRRCERLTRRLMLHDVSISQSQRFGNVHAQLTSTQRPTRSTGAHMARTWRGQNTKYVHQRQDPQASIRLLRHLPYTYEPERARAESPGSWNLC